MNDQYLSISRVRATSHKSAEGAPWSVLCDFDGTITQHDVTDNLLRRFGTVGWREIEAQWEAGLIGSRHCMTQQIGLLDMSLPDLIGVLQTIVLDRGFVPFLDVAYARGMPVEILSDGLAEAIQFILVRHGIHQVPVYANRLIQRGERSWELITPYSHAGCAPDSAHCKCARLRNLSTRVLYIGDGSSDFCIAGHVDFVLAKGRLADYCQANGIAHQCINDFNDALVFLARTERFNTV